MTWADTINDKVARSAFGRYFQLEHSGHCRERKGTRFLTELRAGATTFFAMVTMTSSECLSKPTVVYHICDPGIYYFGQRINYQ